MTEVHSPETPIIACIGFGEAAGAFVSGWGAARAAHIRAYDIKTDAADPAVRDGKWEDYRKAGVIGCDTAAEALRGATVVFSFVTADQAAKAATGAAPLLEKGALFLDCNSCAPGTKGRSAEAVEAFGGRYVDVAVMSPVYPKRHQTPLLLSGPHAGETAALLNGMDMRAKLAPGAVGKASSIKMIRSIMVKGMEALYAECVLSARKAGVDAEVLASLDASFPGTDFPARAAYNLERSLTHGIRRAAEMREVALTVEDLGLPSGMARATVDWQQRLGDLHLRVEDEDYAVRSDAVLAALGDETGSAEGGEAEGGEAEGGEAEGGEASAKPYDDIPGTFVFDADRSREGYPLNMFCMSLRHAANREAFKVDEKGYLDRYPLTAEQRRTVLERDWNGMLRVGGNIYYTSKLAATDGINFQQLAAKMTGVSEEDYRAMMLAGGRPVDGNRRKAEWTHG